MVYVTRTNVDIDDELVAKVMQRYGLASKRAAVDLALRRLRGGAGLTPRGARPRRVGLGRRSRRPAQPNRRVTLVDTSAWVEYLRATGSTTHLAVRGILEHDEPAFTTDVLVMEVLAGARDDDHRDRLKPSRALRPPPRRRPRRIRNRGGPPPRLPEPGGDRASADTLLDRGGRVADVGAGAARGPRFRRAGAPHRTSSRVGPNPLKRTGRVPSRV